MRLAVLSRAMLLLLQIASGRLVHDLKSVQKPCEHVVWKRHPFKPR